MFQKPNRSVDRVFVHCSASDNAAHDNVATIKKWHTAPKPEGRGWSDVGYHFFIRKDGTLEDGRPVSKIPAAQGGNNTGTIAICLHGLDELKFTEAQKAKLRELCLEINQVYDGEVTFHGHREVSSKSCPVFDYRAVLMLDRFGRLGLAGASSRDLFDDTARDPATLPLLKRGARGEAVILAQKLLLIKDDGIFGSRTEAEVRDFQQAHDLGRDGVIGENTWRALLANDRIEHSGES